MGNEPNLLATINTLRHENAKKDEEIRLLKEQVEVLMARAFGKRSERLDPNQLLIPGLVVEECQDPIEVEVIPSYKREKKSGHGRSSFPDHLPRNEILCDLSDADKVCDECQEALQLIGQDITERGHLIPARWLVNRYVKMKYGCPQGHQIKTGKAPDPVLDRCKFEASVYANIVVSKFADHLPLNRQESIFKRHGFKISRSTMCDMVQRVVEIAGEPILEQMHKELMKERLIQADETPITVLQEGKKGSSQGYMWVYISGKKVLLDFRLDRKRDGPNRFLKNFKGGLLQRDGYSGYNEVARRNNLVAIGCWAHARRKFNDALASAQERAGPIMLLIGKLFEIEAELKEKRDELGLSREEFYKLRLDVRTKRSTPVVEAIKTMLLDLEQRPDFLPKSEFGKAVNYAMNQWPSLVAFLDHPEPEIDNNAAERAVKQVALGRKNWMFAGSAKGGHAAAVLYSLVGTCKVLDINPQDYLEDVLTRVATTSASDAGMLTPWAWAAAQLKK